MRRVLALLISAFLAPGSYASAAAVARVAVAPAGLGGFSATGVGAMSFAAPTAGLLRKPLALPSALFSYSNASVAVSQSRAETAGASDVSPSIGSAVSFQPSAQLGVSVFAEQALRNVSGFRQGPAAQFSAARKSETAAAQKAAQNRSPEKLTNRLSALSVQSGRDFARAADSSGESAYGIGRENFARLGGEAAGSSGVVRPARLGESKNSPRKTDLLQVPSGDSAASAPDYKTPQEPAPLPDAARKSQIRTYLLGTATFKIGMEALGVSIPLLALTAFGSATWAAVLAMGWGSAQIIFSSIAGGIIDRRSPSKVLAWAMRLQALSVGTLISLFAVDHFLPGLLGFSLSSPYILLGLYSLAGGFMGVAETARQVMPTELVGENEQGVKMFNAKVHIAYEIAGVVGALLTGLIISQFGVLMAVLLHPPTYLAASFIFSRLQIKGRAVIVAAQDAPLTEKTAVKKAWSSLKRALADLWIGARTLASHPVYRWGALALILPMVFHRILEGLLIPVAAKTLLSSAADSAWIMGASNAGELIGAILLLRALQRGGGEDKFRSHVWVRLMAFGMLGVWVFALYPQLAFILPLIAFRSMTHAASDLSLRSKIQNALPPSLRGRVFGFIGAAAFSLILGASLGLGRLLDALGAGPVFLGVGVAASLLGALMFYAGLKLRNPEDPPKDVPPAK